MKGAIVIARYGATWRGIKPKLAAEHGAVGCIIYSDPADDGYTQGETYPAGPFRPPDGVQRGSVMDMPVYAGDPLTPGVGATKDAKRLKLSEVTTLTKIPTLPISYADAQPLLAAMTGPVAPDRLARRVAHHLSRRSRPREGASQSKFQLGHQDRSTTSSRAFPAPRTPTNGSFAATIMTRGSMAPRTPWPALLRCSKKLAR